MSSRKSAGRRATIKKRATSNVFALFDQAQIQEFKKAFNMIDQNRDGFIDKEDSHDMLASLGKNPTEDCLERMMNEAPGPINLTMFLTLLGERLQGTDPEDVIKNAFGCFDEENNGYINEERLRKLLVTMGDRFSEEDVDEMYREAPRPINFTMFLTLLGERLQGTDPDDVIKNAFGCFDEENNGYINEERLRELLVTMGDRFSDEDVDEMYREAHIKSGSFDYI